MALQNKTVLVTGAGGFIGSHLSERLIEIGAKVKCFLHYNSMGRMGWLEESPFLNQMEIIAGDIRDRDSLCRAIKGSDIIFHLAALIAIPYSYNSPISYVQTNIDGTLNVLQIAREQGVECIIHTSTSEVYGTAQYVPIDENHPLQGQSPYSATKIAADKMAEAYSRSFNLPVVTVRPFNTFGPRQSTRAVIPTIITQCLADKKVKLGNLSPTRDMNYVANTVNGFILAASSPEAIGCTINLGSGTEISIGALTHMIADLMGKSIHIESDGERSRPSNSEVERLLADNTLAYKLLGWQPVVSLREGLSLTIDWIQKHIERYQPGVYIL